MDADIAYSDENSHLNTITLFAKNNTSMEVVEKTKEFYYKNKIIYGVEG